MAVLLLMGLGFWISGYYQQRHPVRDEHFVTVPGWLWLLCGRPLPERRIGVFATNIQMVGYLFALGGLWALLPLPLMASVRAQVVWFVLVIMIGAVNAGVLMYVIRHHDRNPR